jgi:hypothetical protein
MYGTEEFKSTIEAKKRECIGNLIFSFIERMVGIERAPKICGMIIALPFVELVSTILTLDGLRQKVY